jgi:CRISPR/Cas system CSM-associated protein Csm2 small subunit
MRVIYNTCFADPWIKVAQKLQKESNFVPIYWNGYEDDNSRELVPKAFPEVIYHRYFDAWRGVFPELITKQLGNYAIDLDFFQTHAHEELLAIKMMDRMDPDRHSFNFMERQRHYRNMVRYWSVCIEVLKPDIVIQAHIPHRIYDYVLYLLCKHKGITYLGFRDAWPSFTGRALPVFNIASLHPKLETEYLHIKNSQLDVDEIKDQMPEEFLQKYQQVHLDYEKGKPDFVNKYNRAHKKSSGLISLLIKLLSDMTQYRERYFDKDGFFFHGMLTYYKQKKRSIEKSRYSMLGYAIIKLKANAYKRSLKKHYQRYTTSPDLTRPYVVFNMHYQPEMSTSPCGDLFVDQILCVDILLKHLPSHYKIYVKEHPSQFHAHSEGHTSRIKEFYPDLLRNERVELIPLNSDSFKLIRSAQAVATITGTSGWEALALGKPVIIFGLTWYEKFSGVLKVTDEASASRIASFIETYSFDERDLLAYLHAFDQSSVRGYLYRGIKEQIALSEEECVNNISGIIIESLDHA